MQRLPSANAKYRHFAARGIVAEPPKRGDAHLVAPWCDSAQHREGDGADSPTRGGKAAEAARPNLMC